MPMPRNLVLIIWANIEGSVEPVYMRWHTCTVRITGEGGQNYLSTFGKREDQIALIESKRKNLISIATIIKVHY